MAANKSPIGDPAPERAARQTFLLYQGIKLTRREIMDRFNVSSATAKRDMIVLECALPVVRENGKLRLLKPS